MSSSSDDQRFLELLQRWHSGDFTRRDEQALHALTESDDFRREAMEGFLSLPEARHDERLAALRERLQPARPRARVLPMAQILALAAAVLVIIAAIWFFPRTALQDEAPMAQTSEAAPAPVPEPVAPESKATEATTDDALAQNLSKKRPDAPGTSGRSAQKPTVYQPSGVVDDQSLAAAESKEEQADGAISPMETPAAIQTTPPSPAPATATGPTNGEMAASKAKAAPAKSARRAADSTQLAWNETEKKSDLDKLRKEARAEEMPVQSEPQDGWDVFNEYLRQNARLPLDARNHNVSGSVRLRFTINANGDPQNFIVLRSLGYGCDEEAKRLIQNWSWIRGRQPDITLEVKFVR